MQTRPGGRAGTTASLLAFVSVVASTACGHFVTRDTDKAIYVRATPAETTAAIARAAPWMAPDGPDRFTGSRGEICKERGEVSDETVCTEEVGSYCKRWETARVIRTRQECRARHVSATVQAIEASWCRGCTIVMFADEGRFAHPDFLLEDAWFRERRVDVPGTQRRLAGQGTYLESPVTIYLESLRSQVDDGTGARSVPASRVRIAPFEFRIGGGKFDFHLEGAEVMTPTRDGHPWSGGWGPHVGLARALVRGNTVRFSIGYSVGLYNDGVSVDAAGGDSVFDRVHGFRHGPVADLVVFPIATWNLTVRLSARYAALWAKHDRVVYSDAAPTGTTTVADESGSGRRAQLRLYAHAPIGLAKLTATAGLQVARVTYDYPTVAVEQWAIAPFFGVGLGW